MWFCLFLIITSYYLAGKSSLFIQVSFFSSLSLSSSTAWWWLSVWLTFTYHFLFTFILINCFWNHHHRFLPPCCCQYAILSACSLTIDWSVCLSVFALFLSFSLVSCNLPVRISSRRYAYDPSTSDSIESSGLRENESHHIGDKEEQILVLTDLSLKLNVNQGDQRPAVLHDGRSLTAINPTARNTDKDCAPRDNIVFLKTHKAASSTIQNIFLRYGVNHRKVFVLPSRHNYLGHPQPFRRSLVPRPRDFGHSYNILTHHTRLDYEEIRALMPNDTFWVTILRNPIDLFESMFNYYKMDRFWKFKLEQLSFPDAEIPPQVTTQRYVGKIGWNQMLFDLGMKTSDMLNREKITRYIEFIDSIFDLVMISEKMDESLVLLKNALCWGVDDVVAFKVRRPYIMRCLAMGVIHGDPKALGEATSSLLLDPQLYLLLFFQPN